MHAHVRMCVCVCVHVCAHACIYVCVLCVCVHNIDLLLFWIDVIVFFICTMQRLSQEKKMLEIVM